MKMEEGGWVTGLNRGGREREREREGGLVWN